MAPLKNPAPASGYVTDHKHACDSMPRVLFFKPTRYFIPTVSQESAIGMNSS